MQLVTKIVAAYLVIVGLAVFLNLIATPLYHDGSPDYPTWKILNWFMAVAVLIIRPWDSCESASSTRRAKRERAHSITSGGASCSTEASS